MSVPYQQGEWARWQPPTLRPEPGQGPWMSPDGEKWWVVAEHLDEAIAVVRSLDPEAFPSYFAWRAIIEPVLIKWVDPDDWDEETEIVECKQALGEPWAAEAWRITLEDR